VEIFRSGRTNVTVLACHGAASTEGHFENVEEFIGIDGGVTVDKIVAKRNYVSRKVPVRRRLTRHMKTSKT
jgi:hypothetical protein